MNLREPVIVSTWKHGEAANHAGWSVLERTTDTAPELPPFDAVRAQVRPRASRSLDAVETAVKTAEADPNVRSVGYGGFPDRDGRVALDAAVMDHEFRCGAVAGLEHIVHAVSVARHVMEHTPHVLLAGEGALEFALARGFRKERLITAETLRIYEERHLDKAVPVPNIEDHDTIASLALDAEGRLAGACTTSGLTGRLHGRVGDSPIIGAGLYVDGEIGAAAATGVGELAVRVAASAMIVERMRQGVGPGEACELVLDFIRSRVRPTDTQQLGVIALGRDGTAGGASLLPGFSYYVTTSEGTRRE
jgi:isoaspartyl peptidase/L-asparaginase-like protein (Ntn-hydrolase superfamily)